jgi:hypothetical protein
MRLTAPIPFPAPANERRKRVPRPAPSNGVPADGTSPPTRAGPLSRADLLTRHLDGPRLASLFALLLGIATTLYVGGYSFGESNQSVYLLGGMKDAYPTLWTNDWLVSQTTFFHSTFATLTGLLVRAGVLEAGCLVGYLALVFLAHVAWLRMVLRLGGTQVTYLVSLLLFYVSGRGLAPGACDLFQDGSFQPSTIAAVAMLWGMYFRVGGRLFPSATCLGVAGLFHVNFAVMGVGLWCALTAWHGLDVARSRRSARLQQAAPARDVHGHSASSVRNHLAGLGLIVLLSLPSIIPSALRPHVPGKSLPLSEYVDLFVRLRAPHHFDPLSWPLSTWVSFLWPIPLAILAVRRGTDTPARREASRLFVITLGVVGVSIVGAGIWYVSETWIQMFFYRFAIYPKLLSCIGAAWWAGKWTFAARRQPRLATVVVAGGAIALALVILNTITVLPLDALRESTRGTRALVFLCGMVGICGCVSAIGDRRLSVPVYAACLLTVAAQLVASSRWLAYDGWMSPREADYLAMCQWARDPNHTPTDAVFVVPPSEEAFRLQAQRAIVVNFKGLPPFSEQLPEWRDRLEDVLAVNDLRELPRGMSAAGEAMRSRYESLPTGHLVQVARRYGARFVVLSRSHAVDRQAVVYENQSFKVCDVTRADAASVSRRAGVR